MTHTIANLLDTYACLIGLSVIGTAYLVGRFHGEKSSDGHREITPNPRGQA